MKASTKGGNFPPRPIPAADTYPARNYIIADLGTQKSEWKGKEKLLRKVYFCFELIGTKAVFNPEKGEQPFVLSQNFTLSLGDSSNLKPFLESWSGKELADLPIDKNGDLDIFASFGGKSCSITAFHVKDKKDPNKVYCNIKSIAPPIKALGPVAKSENELILFDIDDPNTHGNFEKLPKFVQKMIEESPEWSHNPFEASSPVSDAPDEF